jgi:hypothetical protein
MPILLWYLPYTMFSGAYDLMLSEFEMEIAGEGPAEFGEPLREVTSGPSERIPAGSWGIA